MSETIATNATVSAVKAATEFKYLLDVQPVRSLFNPGGVGDARDGAAYARAARLLSEAVAQSNNSSASPGSMLGSGVPVVDLVANAGGQMPTQTLNVLQGVREAIIAHGFEEVQQGHRRSEDSGFLEIRFRTFGQADQILEFGKGVGNAIHSTTPPKVNEQPLCHGNSANDRGGS